MTIQSWSLKTETDHRDEFLLLKLLSVTLNVFQGLTDHFVHEILKQTCLSGRQVRNNNYLDFDFLQKIEVL